MRELLFNQLQAGQHMRHSVYLTICLPIPTARPLARPTTRQTAHPPDPQARAPHLAHGAHRAHAPHEPMGPIGPI